MRAMQSRYCSARRGASAAGAAPSDWVGRRREQHSARDCTGDARCLDLRFGANGIRRDSFGDEPMEPFFMSEQAPAPSPLIPIPRAPVPQIPADAACREIEITIDGKRVTVPEGATILDATRKLAIETPTLCYLETLTPVNTCRICVVELEGCPTPVPSCSRKAEAGLGGHTGSEPVRLRPRLPVAVFSSAVGRPAPAPPSREVETPCGPPH